MAGKTSVSDAPSPRSGHEDAGPPREELARCQEEMLRLRDLLIARDAELGKLKGELAQLEAGTARLLNLVTRVRSFVPGSLWKLASGLLRRLAPRA
jgi:hypothetical protein